MRTELEEWAFFRHFSEPTSPLNGEIFLDINPASIIASFANPHVAREEMMEAVPENYK